MRSRTTLIAVLSLAAACSPAAPAYLGHWSPDQSTADLSKVTWTYEAVDSTGYRITVDGQTFMLPTDGSEAQTPWGGTMTLVAIDSATWTSVSRVNGTVVSNDTVMLSPDGLSLTMHSHMLGPDGTPTNTAMEMHRATAQPGLAGTWEGMRTTGNAMLGDLVITATGGDSLSLDFKALQTTCTIALGGGDAPVTSPMLGDGWTCAAARSDSGFTLDWKRNGENRYSTTYTVIAGGDSLREVSTAQGTNEPVTVVYGKQAM